MVGDDLSKFLLDVVASYWFTSKTSKHGSGLVEVTFLDEISWGFRKEEETTTQDKSPGHLKTNWNSVGAGIETVLGTIGDTGCEKKTNGNAELVTRN